MAVGSYVKNAGLAALGLASSAVPVFAQTVGELGQEQQINLPPLPDLTPALAWIFNLPTPTSENMIYLKFIIFLLFLVVFIHLLIIVFKDNRTIAGVVGTILALLGIKLVPNEPLLIFASSLGTTLSAASVLALPIFILYITYTLVKESEYKWKILGAMFMAVGGIQLYATAIIGFFSASPLFSYIAGFVMIGIGAVLFFMGLRVRAFAHISEKAETAALQDMRVALKDANYEIGNTAKAIQYVNEVHGVIAGLAAPVLAGANLNFAALPAKVRTKLWRARTDLWYTWDAEKRANMQLMSKLKHELALFKSSGGPYATYTSEIQQLWSLAKAQVKKEGAAFADLSLVFDAIKSKKTIARTTVINALVAAVGFLKNEEQIALRIRQLIGKVEREIGTNS